MKIVILGGGRYVGRCCVNLLLDAQCDVVTVTRSPIEKISDNHIHEICDRKDWDALAALLRKISPDAVLDMVCFDKNDGEGIRRLYEKEILSTDTTYIMVSSFYLYNYMQDHRKDFRGDHAQISDGYTRRKAEAEKEIESLSTIVRMPFVFSNDDYSGRFQRFCKLAEGGKVKLGTGTDRKCSLISKESAAMVLKKIVMLGDSSSRYIDVANPGCHSFLEMLSIISDVQNVKLEASGCLEMPIQDIYGLDRDICLEPDETICSELPTLREALQQEAMCFFKEGNL